MFMVNCVATLAAAVNSPVELMVPAPAGLIVHTTPVLLVWFTLAVNCCVWPPVSNTLFGVTLTITGGISVAVAVIGCAETPSGMAEIVTACWEVILSGAV